MSERGVSLSAALLLFSRDTAFAAAGDRSQVSRLWHVSDQPLLHRRAYEKLPTQARNAAFSVLFPQHEVILSNAAPT